MPIIKTQIPSGSPPVSRSIQLHDWTGGLNLRDDAFQLAQNETPDCLDIDISAQGGFERRKTVRNAVSGAFGSGNPTLLTQFVGNSVVQVIIGNVVTATDKVHYSTAVGGAVTAVSLSGTSTTAAWRAASMARISSANSERLYIQRNAEHVVARFNGSAVTDLGDAVGNYNANVAAPAGGFMPKARVICNHLSYMFHGDILEASRFSSRIRWSHPGEPEDYKTGDYIDVASGDGDDRITALASYQGNLFIFKDRSTWILTGFDSDTFALHKIADVGAISQEAVATSAYGLAAFDARRGVHAAVQHGQNGWSMEPLWNKLYNKIEDGTIQSAYIANIAMGWMGQRLYVSVPYGASVTVNNRTFVFDPFVGKNGAWWLYGLGFFRFHEWRRAGLPSIKFGCEAGHPTYFHQLEAGSTTDILTGTTETNISAYLYTAWLDGGDPALKKRWRRMTATFDQQLIGVMMNINVWKNWSTRGASRLFQLSGTAESGGLEWGENWGGTWQQSITGDQATVRGGTVGSAYAVAAKIAGPLDRAWGLNSLNFRFVPQRII